MKIPHLYGVLPDFCLWAVKSDPHARLGPITLILVGVYVLSAEPRKYREAACDSWAMGSREFQKI